MRFLTQEQLVRKAVAEGLGRALRQVHTEEQVGPPTENITRLVARFSNNEPHFGSTFQRPSCSKARSHSIPVTG